ncbi:MAG: hypothetical protein AB7N73_14940 [Gemmatimonadales bacterium]
MDPQQLDPVSALGALGASALFGLVKKYTGLLDGRIGRAVKPLQPAIVTAAGIGLPFLTQLLGIAPVDPAAFTTAPLTTVALVSTREAWQRLSGAKK